MIPIDPAYYTALAVEIHERCRIFFINGDSMTNHFLFVIRSFPGQGPLDELFFRNLEDQDQVQEIDRGFKIPSRVSA